MTGHTIKEEMVQGLSNNAITLDACGQQLQSTINNNTFLAVISIDDPQVLDIPAIKTNINDANSKISEAIELLREAADLCNISAVVISNL